MPDLVREAAAEAPASADTISHFGEDSPRARAYATHRLPWSSGVVTDEASLADLDRYKANVSHPHGAAWLDNTTLVTATTLLSDDAWRFMTPLTAWDLATYCRAVACYERIYHHEHPEVDDQRINTLLGANVLHPVPLPVQPTVSDDPLPEPWNGAHRLICEFWQRSYGRLRDVRSTSGTSTVDGRFLVAIRAAWTQALKRDDLELDDFVNIEDANTRWTSPSNRLLMEIADITQLGDSVDLDSTEPSMRSSVNIGALLTDLNLRALVNQHISDYFELPYAASMARAPFHTYLYDEAVAVQSQLHTAGIIDKRYGQLADGVQLRLPVFLALAIKDARRPSDVWIRLAQQRQQAEKFRARRVQLDEAVGRRDLKELRALSKALQTDTDSLLAIAGKVSTVGAVAAVEEVARGDPSAVASGIAAVAAARRKLVTARLGDLLLWRLRRPHLLYLHSLMDEAQCLTEALPDFSRIWQIPTREQGEFASRFMAMAKLQLNSRPDLDPRYLHSTEVYTAGVVNKFYSTVNAQDANFGVHLSDSDMHSSARPSQSGREPDSKESQLE